MKGSGDQGWTFDGAAQKRHGDSDRESSERQLRHPPGKVTDGRPNQRPNRTVAPLGRGATSGWPRRWAGKMKMPRLELRPLQVEDELSFRKAVDEFRHDTPPWEFAFQYDHLGNFSEYVNKLENWSHGLELPGNFVPNSFYVGVVDGLIVGRLSLRHCLNNWLRRIGGHIGYGVIPTQRKRGYATDMLRQVLPICAKLRIENVLLTCDVDNIGSRQVIEKCGGVLDKITDYPDLA